MADDYVEMDFGTGVVKITPAHDPNDFEVGLRHNLEVINVMTDDAKIVDAYPKHMPAWIAMRQERQLLKI